MHVHGAAESPRFDTQAHGPHFVDRSLVGRVRWLGGHGVIETGTASPKNVAVERELADQEYRPTDVAHTSRHFPGGRRLRGIGAGGVVLEDPQIRDFREHPCTVLGGVVSPEANKGKKPSSDGADYLALDFDPRAANALHDSPHGVSMRSSRANRDTMAKYMTRSYGLLRIKKSRLDNPTQPKQ
jgi:hypothetical protein